MTDDAAAAAEAGAPQLPVTPDLLFSARLKMGFGVWPCGGYTLHVRGLDARQQGWDGSVRFSFAMTVTARTSVLFYFFSYH